MGSRNRNRPYCRDDGGKNFGSSVSDLDYAQHNVVVGNRIVKRSVSDMIRTGAPTDAPNIVAHNETVQSAAPRRSGCWVPSAFASDFITDGTAIDLFEGQNGEPVCLGHRVVCDDGALRPLPGTTTCNVRKVDFECQVSGNNQGCQRAAACPDGTRVIGAVAACNLEYGGITPEALATVRAGTIKVLEASDSVSDGTCFVGPTRVRRDEQLIQDMAGPNSVSFGCREHDRNGGDCQIRGILYCR